MAKRNKHRDRRLDSDEEEYDQTDKNANSSKGGERSKDASKDGSSVVCLQPENAGIDLEQITRAIERVAEEQRSGPGVDLTGGELDIDAAEGKFGHNPVETCINEVHTAPQRSGKIR